MTLRWLTFRDGGAVIIEGESIIHARLLAAVNDLYQASHFVEGDPIDPALVEEIPQDFIWRSLSRQQASDMLRVLRDGPRKAACSATTAAGLEPRQLRLVVVIPITPRGERKDPSWRAVRSWG
jgi:hypothetical protein